MNHEPTTVTVEQYNIRTVWDGYELWLSVKDIATLTGVKNTSTVSRVVNIQSRRKLDFGNYEEEPGISLIDGILYISKSIGISDELKREVVDSLIYRRDLSKRDNGEIDADKLEQALKVAKVTKSAFLDDGITPSQATLRSKAVALKLTGIDLDKVLC